ncbi:50S ribosomal protein L31 type B [unidentified eubacterium SCB49]|nr:50S ribosomal protein L31 type B [unidentified eubacterium SCB49]
MEIEKGSVKKVAMQYGLILGLASVMLSVVVYAMGQTYEQPWWQSVLSFVIMLGCIVYALKAFKKDNSGFLSLSEAIKVGLAVALLAGIIGVFFNFIFTTVIEPDFTANIIEKASNDMVEQNPNMTEEQMEMALSITEKMTSPVVMAAMGIIMSLFFGFVISLISGLIMKVEKPAHLE